MVRLNSEPNTTKFWYRRKLIYWMVGVVWFACMNVSSSGQHVSAQNKVQKIIVGAEQPNQYLPLLKKQKVALVANQTSRVGTSHLLDTLLAMGVNVKKVFVLEHGFRGTADAGETIHSALDSKTGLPIVSLYGKNKKPTQEDLKGIDVVIFDIQDVGVRFYTYISSLHYIMEAVAESEGLLLVFDRPNPNGFYVDGPVLKPDMESFVGMHPVPLVHGMTVGEYAKMINGEGWLSKNLVCRLKVIRCEGYSHTDLYELPVKPSPNLPNMTAVYLYPSLGLFEGTKVSVGRGTDRPFQILGYPGFKEGTLLFTPKSMPGAKYPKHENQVCSGFDFSEFGRTLPQKQKRLNVSWLIQFYQTAAQKEDFFTAFFDKLSGDPLLKEQIESNTPERAIRESWENDINQFLNTRSKYLLYQDFY